MKDIKKILSEQSSDVLPDNSVKEKIKHELGYDRQTQYVASYAGGGEAAANGKNNRTIITAAIIIAVITVFLCVFLPVFLKNDSVPVGTIDKFAQITDAESFYAYGAASVGSIITSADAYAISSDEVGLMSARSAADNEEQIAVINRYMSLVEGLIGSGKIAEQQINATYGYQFGMSVSFTDLLGETTSYRLYYNKIFQNGETDGDETEENYSIEGILMIGDSSYPVEGNYQTESESDEQENELYFTAYINREAQSFIRVSQEYESETEDGSNETEKQYVYSIYNNGKLTERTSIDYETEDGELELQLTIRKNGKSETLVFSGETTNGEQVISVRGNIDGQSVRFRIYVKQGEYHYVFDDGSSSDQSRPSHYDDDFDDDDDD